ncbi:glycoside hydrolase family 19 protein [Nocardia mexicana]|uniref:Putative chitinase n=1 Tax=Nocardia mexicana TaxID=279262 RepID=A0A370H5J4_9NOCA|nr:glycoside hydrolase family 19 protein [Nocardia mexicana]RDI51652.1 putative chitinase [Nocardia mexicana]
MIPPRPVVLRWRALEAADLLCAELDRRIEELETLSATVRDTCHRLDGDGWQGLSYDAVRAHVDAAHRQHQVLCEHAEKLREAGARALSDLHYTALALLDYVADAEAAGCRIADDWSVVAGETAQEWAEVIAEAVAAVERADQRGRAAIAAVGAEIAELARAFDFPRLILDGLGALVTPGGQTTPDVHRPGGPETADRTGSGEVPGTANEEPRPGPSGRPDDEPIPSDASPPGAGEVPTEPPPPDDVFEPEGSTSGVLAAAEDGESAESAEGAPSAEGSAQSTPSAAEDAESVEPAATVPGTARSDETTSAAPGPATSAQDGQFGPVGRGMPGTPAETAAVLTANPHNQGEPSETGVVASVPAAQPHTAIDPPPGITAEQLVAIMPDLPLDRAQEYLPALNTAMAEGGITTPPRQAAFLAQLAHESCQLRYFEELGDDDYFSQYDPGQPNTAAGNTEPGDGPRYHGRGPIQLTGRGNYRAAGEALGLDLEGNPELAAAPDIGFRIAQWYWTSRDINTLADMGDFAAVTQAVNGGFNGLAAREEYFQRALAVLG